MKCTICNEEKPIVDFVSIYDPLECKDCSPPPMPDDKTCDRCGQLKSEFFFVSSQNPDVCGTCRDELRSPTTATVEDVADIETQPVATGRQTSDEDDPKLIRKVFKRLFWGWSVLFVLAWFINHDLKFLLEIITSVIFGAVAALISTLIYWGIREFLKPNADTVRRADAAETEIAELRRKVEELSNKPDH